MAAIDKISVSLTPEIADFVRDAVEKGIYADSSDAVRDALTQLKERSELHGYTISELRGLWDQGIQGGPAMPGGDAMATLRAKYMLAPQNSGR